MSVFLFLIFLLLLYQMHYKISISKVSPPRCSPKLPARISVFSFGRSHEKFLPLSAYNYFGEFVGRVSILLRAEFLIFHYFPFSIHVSPFEIIAAVLFSDSSFSIWRLFLKTSSNGIIDADDTFKFSLLISFFTCSKRTSIFGFCNLSPIVF